MRSRVVKPMTLTTRDLMSFCYDITDSDSSMKIYFFLFIQRKKRSFDSPC